MYGMMSVELSEPTISEANESKETSMQYQSTKPASDIELAQGNKSCFLSWKTAFGNLSIQKQTSAQWAKRSLFHGSNRMQGKVPLFTPSLCIPSETYMHILT